ncbi:PTS sugar transporter subunit IIA [Neobacillus sp. NPDC097160]|uniref:PTS sugar transporter subunit IIA n=1 Tax=Neobacillus sp. NPDC097160 TaxID=3364298 RepID=UPI00381F32F6
MTSMEKFNIVRNVYAQIGNPAFNQPSIKNIMNIIEEYTKVTDRVGLERSLYELFTNHKIDPQEVSQPVLSEITNERLIQLDVEATDWQDAIRKSGQPLVNEGKVSLQYIQAMIDTASESGPYIVIAKHVALPHARPEAGSKEIAISMSKLKNPIKFGNNDNDPVKYVFCLSAIDNETHLTAMAELVELLECSQFYEMLDEARDPKEIYEFILEHEKVESK